MKRQEQFVARSRKLKVVRTEASHVPPSPAPSLRLTTQQCRTRRDGGAKPGRKGLAEQFKKERQDKRHRRHLPVYTLFFLAENPKKKKTRYMSNTRHPGRCAGRCLHIRPLRGQPSHSLFTLFHFSHSLEKKGRKQGGEKRPPIRTNAKSGNIERKEY